MIRFFSFLRSVMDAFDSMGLPVSGPFAGLDPAQEPVIVDKAGQPVVEHEVPRDGTWSAAEDERLVDALIALCMTHTVQIETAPGAPVHRLVIGDGTDLRVGLASALGAALEHHKQA